MIAKLLNRFEQVNFTQYALDPYPEKLFADHDCIINKNWPGEKIQCFVFVVPASCSSCSNPSALAGTQRTGRITTDTKSLKKIPA